MQVSACAYSLQPRDQARVQIGPGPEQAQPAAPYTSLYIPYAMMTSLAYTGADHLNADRCPDPASLDAPNDSPANAWMRSLRANHWRCVFGLSEAQPCPRRYPNCRPFNGPDLQVWRRNDTPCSEVVIAYRGLNLRDPVDWPNLRWLFKLSRFGDAAQIDGILAASGCRAAGRVIAAGHSLGGGYAEDGAYANRRVRYVYAFNAFPVASLDLDPSIRNQRGLGIDLVHEVGDLFSVLRLFRPASACNPRVRIVRFNLIPFGPPIIAHNIDALTLNMFDVSRGVRAKPALAYRAAAHCASSS